MASCGIIVYAPQESFPELELEKKQAIVQLIPVASIKSYAKSTRFCSI
uniref:DUF3330 domain-containing protein n=1 Tax=Heterorhabditis bacteriophora TaxID=37862 RepID=A0A1I7XNH1_HETBA